MMRAVHDGLIEETEFQLLLEGVLNCYGYDFRDYDMAPLKRRIWEQVHLTGVQTLSGYQEKILHEPACMELLLLALREQETVLFRDADFWLTFRAIVVPILRTFPSIQIWVPGCAGGEDVFSLAIFLNEEGLQHRARIYATDLNEAVLKKAQAGIFPLSRIADDAERYQQAGGSRSFSEYYRVERDHALFKDCVMELIVFAEHNLGTDGPFNLFQTILCRRALGAFNEWLQERVHALFMESLSRFGVLALGIEGLPKLPLTLRYQRLPVTPNLYRKVE
jgi:chemotaxis protein methyltransferase CheR